MVSINSVKIGFVATKIIVWNTYNTYKFLEAVLYQLHKSICTYLIQNKKKTEVLSILYQRFILKSNRRYFPRQQFTSSQINFCNSTLVYRFYTQQKQNAYKTPLWISIYTRFLIKNSIIVFLKYNFQISLNIDEEKLNLRRKWSKSSYKKTHSIKFWTPNTMRFSDFKDFFYPK